MQQVVEISQDMTYWNGQPNEPFSIMLTSLRRLPRLQVLWYSSTAHLYHASRTAGDLVLFLAPLEVFGKTKQ